MSIPSQFTKGFFFWVQPLQLTCLIVMAGLQSLSSSKIDKHTVPDGYTFGWNKGGSNLPVEEVTR